MSVEDQPYLQRACPTCGSTALDPSWVMSSSPPAEACSLDDLRSSWRGFFKDQKHFFTYNRCKSCGQVYAPRYFTPEQLSDLYQHMEDNTAGLPESLLARTQDGYLELLLKNAHLSMGGYIEFGPDIGLLTKYAMELAVLNRFWMVEPNQAVYPNLERLLGRREYTLLSDPGQIDEVPDNSLAMAVAIHVLDHFLEPQQLLERLMPKLRSGGWILLVTHNGSSLLARAFGRRWPAYCLQHPQIYSRATLKQCLSRAGFSDIRVMRTVNYFPVMYLLRHLLFAAGLGRISLPEFSSWTVGLKLGNIAAIGQKP